MKSGTESKFKFKQLQRRLDLALWQARGLLDTLWFFVAHNCPAGDVGKFSDEEIAIGIDWRGDPGQLVETLVATKWLDRHETHRLVVHDWPEHCEDGVKKTLAKNTEVFWDGSLPTLTRFKQSDRDELLDKYKDRFGAVAVKKGRIQERIENAPERAENAPALPSLTEPSPTIPSQEEGAAVAASRGTDSPPQTMPADLRPEEIPLPPELSAAPFPAAWSEWIAYRRKRRLTMRPETLSKQLASLAKLGPHGAAGCIDLSIRSGWQGVFPEKVHPPNGKRDLADGPGQTFDPNARKDPNHGRM